MCGIIGAIAGRDVVQTIIGGLKRVEYRGYDSAGIAVLNGCIKRVRKEGKVAALEAATDKARLTGNLAIGHTRWATQGSPSEANAHPHMSRDEVVVVHNGIIENFRALRSELQEKGYEFESQTDTEVVAHLVHYHTKSLDLLPAVQQAIRRLKGAYALVVCSMKDTSRMIAARKGPSLLIGLGNGENFAASDRLAIVHETRNVKYLEDGDVADIERTKVTIYDKDGQPVERKTHRLDPAEDDVDKGPYDYYMQKEIHEQPKALLDTIEQVLKTGVSPLLFGDTERVLEQVVAVRFLACGTSSYAGRVAQQWIESIAKIPAFSEIASEYKDRDSIPNPQELIVTISQSGETADTAEALRRAKELGCERTLSICNVKDSTIPRESKLVFYTRAGIEVGVASTKAFTTQLAALFILTLTLAKVKGRLTAEQEADYLEMLRKIPGSVQHALNLEPQIQLWAKSFAGKRHALFLGRGVHHPVALEGALKLKEITYIHAEAYPAGELKHGPLALVGKSMPVVVIAPNDKLFAKIEANISEVRARKAQLYVFTDEGSTYEPNEKGIHVMRLPRHDGILSPIMHVIPVQLLAYHTAVLMKRDVDKPRNLAKSVTVE